MNKVIIILLFIFTTSLLFAQKKEKKAPEYGWKNQVVGDLNFTQNAFSDNWAGGGENSWSWAVNIDAKFENDQEKYNLANSGKLAYGQASIGGNEARKAADEISLESVYTHKYGTFVNPYAAVSMHSQFTKGYQYSDTNKIAIADFFDPGYFTESFGIGFKPNEIIKTRVGFAVKQTFTNKYSNLYADGNEFRNEIGAESVTDLNMKLAEQILYVSKLELFTDFNGIDAIDANWGNTFSAKVSEIIKVSFDFQIHYDKDVHFKRQLKQTLAVGLSYSFL